MKYKTEDDTSRIDSWIKFYKGFNFCLYIDKAGYFDERPQLHTSVTQMIIILLIPFILTKSFLFLLLIPFMFIGWGKLYISFPISTGIQDCDSAAWGFNYHNDTIWIYIGGGGNFEGGKKWKTFEMPWALNWYRTSILLNDETWEHEFKGSRKDFHRSQWDEKKWCMRANYLDDDDTLVGSKITMSEREWRRKGLMFTTLFSKVKRTIDVNFDEEVGPGKGSWKGGTIGTGYEIKPGENISDCLKRNGFTSLEMERDEKLNKILN
jgi:hypothetical protein